VILWLLVVGYVGGGVGEAVQHTNTKQNTNNKTHHTTTPHNEPINDGDDNVVCIVVSVTYGCGVF